MLEELKRATGRLLRLMRRVYPQRLYSCKVAIDKCTLIRYHPYAKSLFWNNHESVAYLPGGRCQELAIGIQARAGTTIKIHGVVGA